MLFWPGRSGWLNAYMRFRNLSGGWCAGPGTGNMAALMTYWQMPMPKGKFPEGSSYARSDEIPPVCKIAHLQK